ncbi:MAG: response regulator transcription factor [Gammaproteobacteria bacterium]|nr:response regulator transcription factor [Gammaproteobacteria bacterium]
MTTETEPTVFIVDDDDAVRNAIKLLMKSVGRPARTFASGDEFLDAFDASWRGCLVLDIRMPGMSGLELQEKLNSLGSLLEIVFITGHGDVPMAVQAMKHGAAEFLQKPFRDQELIEHVNKLCEKAIDKQSNHTEEHKVRQRLDELSDREREIMHRIVDGHANKAIAIDLDLSPRTVEVHRSNIMRKMQARSLAHLIRMVLFIEAS